MRKGRKRERVGIRFLGQNVICLFYSPFDLDLTRLINWLKTAKILLFFNRSALPCWFFRKSRSLKPSQFCHSNQASYHIVSVKILYIFFRFELPFCRFFVPELHYAGLALFKFLKVLRYITESLPLSFSYCS